MIEFEWIAIAVGVSVVSIIITGLLVVKRYNKKIEGYSSIKEAIKETQASLDNLMAKSTEVSGSLSASQKELEIVEARTKKLVELEARSTEIRDLLENRKSSYEALLAKIKENVTVHDFLDKRF